MRRIDELGERKVIETLWKCFDVMPRMPLAFGDDVSAVELDAKRLAIVKVDMLVGKTDIPQEMTLRQAARKTVVMNVSDFAAKGIKPIAILSSLGLPRSLNEEDVKQIGMGLNDGVREYGAYVIGGDTNESSDIIIDCALLGFCRKNVLVKRSGAKPGDIVAITGQFGKTASGLRMLLEHLSVPSRIREVLLESVLMPKARLKEGLALAEGGVLTASIDSSDGLAWSLYELSEASNVGFLIDTVPTAPEVEEFADFHGFNSLDLIFYGGEEYELVVTVKPSLWKKAVTIAEKVGGTLIRIGEAVKQKEIELKMGEITIPIERKGWEHFKIRA